MAFQMHWPPTEAAQMDALSYMVSTAGGRMRALKKIGSRYLAPAAYERDSGFREIILQLSRRGLFAAGLLGIIAMVLFVGAYHLLLGKNLSWSYNPADPSATLVLWDKLAIVGLGVAALMLSRSRFGIRWGRLLVGMLLVAVLTAYISDDVARGETGKASFSSAFLLLCLLVAVGTMPYRLWQTAVLGFVLVGTYALCLAYLPEFMGAGLERQIGVSHGISHLILTIESKIGISRLIYITIAILIAASISELIYRSRYAQYRTRRQLEQLLMELETAQAQLVQQEKLASLGRLTAGIAHEIKNPLNFINNFADLSAELTQELIEELETHRSDIPAGILEKLTALLSDLHLNAERINEHGQRADGIVRAMMLHAKSTKGERELTDLNVLVEEYVKLAQHGTRLTQPEPIHIEQDYDPAVGQVELVPQHIARVLVNLLSNAFDAVHQRGSSGDDPYEPAIRVRTQGGADQVEIRVQDNGPGVPVELRQRIFEPFFTTKPAGSGTGLGLWLSYEIVVQEHGGALELEGGEGPGATFVVRLPRHWAE